MPINLIRKKKNTRKIRENPNNKFKIKKKLKKIIILKMKIKKSFKKWPRGWVAEGGKVQPTTRDTEFPACPLPGLLAPPPAGVVKENGLRPVGVC